MIWLDKLKGSFYTLFFILLSIIYLIIELSFNARILDASAALTPTTDFAQLEIYGRTISASGATLFAWRLLVPCWSSCTLLRLMLKFLAIALLVFPLVFIGQKTLVDKLVDQSSSETRRSAEILSLLKFGVANGFVEIEELAVDELLLQTAEGKMFITLSGLLAYNSSNMRVVLERELEKITGYAIATQQSLSSLRLYKNYRYVSKNILVRYKEYQQLVEDLELRQSGSYLEAIRLYEGAMNNALRQWLDYQQLLEQSSGISAISAGQVASIQYLLMTAQQRVNNCSNAGCYNDGLQQLEQRLTQQLGFFSPVDDWCQSFEHDGLKLQCLKDSLEIERFILHTRKLTLALSAGLTQVYPSRLEYLKSNDLRSSVFSQLKREGIESDAAWSFTEHENMLSAIRQQLDGMYLEVYDYSVLTLFGEPLPPRSTASAFSQIASMQNYFAQAFGEMYRQPVALNLTQKEFEASHLAPLYAAKFDALLNKLKADEKWYERDAPYEQSGKTSLRNLVVPAVAIAFSLIFGLLNMVSLLLNLLFLLIEEKRWLRWAGMVVLLTMILMMPLRHQYLIYSQPAYLDLLSETEKNYGLWASALDWVARTEPLLYPLGNVLRYRLLDGFGFD